MNITLYALNQNRKLVQKDVSSLTSKTITGNFRKAVDLINPVIEVTDVDYLAVLTYNYVYIETLHRYYFIDNVRFIDKQIIELSLHEDVLKSYSNYILQAYGYIERSYNMGYDYLVDNLLPIRVNDYVTESKCSESQTSGATVDEWTPNLSSINNIFVIYFVTTDSSIYGTLDNINPPSSNGVLNSYSSFYNGDNLNTIAIITNKSGLQSFCSWMLNHENTAKSVLGIYAMPFEPKHDSTPLSTIYMGKERLTIGGSGDEIQGTFYNYKDNYNTLADFSLTNDIYFNYYRWLNYQSKFQLWVPFVGWIDLEYTQVENHRLQLNYLIKASTGKAVVTLTDIDRHQLVYTSTANIGTEIVLPNSNAETLKTQAIQDSITNAIKVVGGTISVAMGVAGALPTAGASTGAIVGGVTSIVSGVASEGKTIQNTLTKGQTTVSGSVNSSSDFMSLPLEPRIRSMMKAPIIKGSSTLINNYLKTCGLPCRQVMRINELEGYAVITDIQMNDFLGTSIELEEIKALLASGVYITNVMI